MLHLINEFTDKDAWVYKALEEEFMEAWKNNILKQGDVTPKMADWLLDELKFKAIVAKRTEYSISVFNGDVVKSNCQIMGNLQQDLAVAIKSLERGLASFSEYRLVTERREFDYVHPSFFPIVFGETRCLRDRTIGLDDAVDAMGQGEVIPVPKDPGPSRKDLSWNIASRSDIGPRPYSSRFQWLPSDIHFRPDGTCYFSSYINNIHPKRNRHFYGMFEKTLDKIIRMWDMCLTPVKTVLHSRARIELQEVKYEPISPGTIEPRPEVNEDESRDLYEDRLREWRRKNFVAIQPEPGVFAPISIPPQILEELPPEEQVKHRIEDAMDLVGTYGHRGLQVIVKLAEYSATPEQPQFNTELEFRQIADLEPLADIEFDRGDTVWLEQIFGLHNNEPAVQEVGGVKILDGRAITWPNTLQHRGVLELEDKTKPGYAQILQFMLIDPNIRVISTANVPPQRLDWKHEVDVAPVDVTKLSLEEKLKVIPREGRYPWALQEAKDILHEARIERQEFNRYQDVAFHSKNVAL
ncbi:hypothetical protein PISL3812_03748 [Talaromyces islandicus]|uniref:DUF4246 domain-containing protein n=1 Tax=Talaromyces islandicus TaxID=28573 RepID=A0A0U1LTK2_TALIS|nr:hypothetical protein PISL3812_03748 [Talaromyces islandicus]